MDLFQMLRSSGSLGVGGGLSLRFPFPFRRVLPRGRDLFFCTSINSFFLLRLVVLSTYALKVVTQCLWLASFFATFNADVLSR